MAKIELDPVTKLPIWPGGVVPAHPTDKQGNLIAPPPVYQPPLQPTPPSMEKASTNPAPVDWENTVAVLQADVENLKVEVAQMREAMNILNTIEVLQMNQTQIRADYNNLDGRLVDVEGNIYHLDARLGELEKTDVDPVQTP